MLRIDVATKRYESWLKTQTKVIPRDLKTKHDDMASDAFTFLRATFYRWAQVWPEACSELTSAPSVLSVGDLHVENFGTWRDSEGRLVWGINDFDEACHLPYTSDLARLVTSAILAISQNELQIKVKAACEAILSGYSAGIESGGSPHVLSEHFWWLRDLAINKRRDPVKFWKKLNRFRRINVPSDVATLIRSALPGQGKDCWFVKRISGEGSLGRQRFVGISEWKGSYVAREAKALVPSAAVWAAGRDRALPLYDEIVSKAVRCPDPYVGVSGSWILRRLAPDCSRIELSAMPKARDESRLLSAMGWETANIHLGSKEALDSIKKDLKRRPSDWLQTAAEKMARATRRDFKEWKAR